MKSVLVTGGCGFMGSNFIRFLLQADPGASIINLDALTYAANPQNLAGLEGPRYRFVHGSITDPALVRRLMAECDAVVNFAAETHVDRSIHGHAGDFMRTNIEGVHVLLEALREAPNIEKFVHISTDEVWGDLLLDAKEKFDETSPLQPNSPYAASKAAGDLLARAYAQTYGLPIVVSHSVNNFGPRQFPEKLIPYFTLHALRGTPLPLYGDGTNVRDWIHVDDHSSAIFALLRQAQAGSVYAISAGQEYSNRVIAQKILHILEKSPDQIAFVKDRPGHDLRYSVHSAKLRALGWLPQRKFDEALKETVLWYAENPSWLAAIANQRENINEHIFLQTI